MIQDFIDSEKKFSFLKCNKMEDAFHFANKLSEKGDVVLLSPGTSSFYEFSSFEERGEYFCKKVRELNEKGIEEVL